jgi:glycosyltransferase involved in cell wall biosynthesis
MVRDLTLNTDITSDESFRVHADSKIRIGIVFGSDFQGNPPGGGQPTIEIFLKYAQEQPFEIWLLGMTTSKAEPIGRVSKRRIYGRDYPFVPLFYFDAKRYSDQKPLIPLRIQALWAYMRRRRVVDALNFDLLYLHAPEALPFLWGKRKSVLYHIHGTQESAAQYSRYPLFKTKLFSYPYHAWVGSILARANEFIVIDQESYDLYAHRVPEKKDRLHLLPTAIDVDQFCPLPDFDRSQARRSFDLPATGKMVLYVGRLSWKKGVDLLLKAFSLVRTEESDAFLAIAGDGEDRKGLEALAMEIGLGDRVFFLGQVPHLPSSELPRLFNCADVSVVASLHESLALVITEALACGVPVVSTPVGIAPLVILDGVTGYLVHSREPGEMAHRILQIIREESYVSSKCVSTAQRYSETSKRICDVILTMCPATHKSDSDDISLTGFRHKHMSNHPGSK